MRSARVATVIIVICGSLLLPRTASAHCDTLDGPVVTAARLALKTGDVTPVLKWVGPSDEAQIRAAFERTMKVRTLSAEARELSDTHFFETLVRVHRAGEGMPFTGLKPAGTEVEPGIALADKVLEDGSPDELVKRVTAEVAQNLRQRFAHVTETGKRANDSVEAGRQYVAAYVEFIHYVERIHQALTMAAGHAQGEERVEARR